MNPSSDRGAAATRASLLEAGLFCFSEQGFEGTSLRQLAERSGKPSSLIAHHFGNKEGLFLAVLKAMLAERPQGQFPGPFVSLEELRDDPVQAAELLRKVVIGVFKGMRDTFESGDPRRMAQFRLWQRAVRSPIPELEPLLRERLATLRTQIAACIQALRPDLPTREIPFWCALVYGQCVANTMMHDFNQLVFGPDCYPDSPDHMAEQIADITLRAIGTPPTRQPGSGRSDTMTNHLTPSLEHP